MSDRYVIVATTTNNRSWIGKVVSIRGEGPWVVELEGAYDYEVVGERGPKGMSVVRRAVPPAYAWSAERISVCVDLAVTDISHGEYEALAKLGNRLRADMRASDTGIEIAKVQVQEARH